MTFVARGSCALNGAWFTRIRVPFPLAQDSARSTVFCNKSCLSYVVRMGCSMLSLSLCFHSFVSSAPPSLPLASSRRHVSLPCFLLHFLFAALLSHAMSINHSSATLRSSCSVLLGSSGPGSSLRDALLSGSPIGLNGLVFPVPVLES